GRSCRPRPPPPVTPGASLSVSWPSKLCGYPFLACSAPLEVRPRPPARPHATYHHPPVEAWEASTPAGSAAGPHALAELQRVTDAALAHLTLDDLLSQLRERVAHTLRAD